MAGGQKTVLVVIAPRDFRDEEYYHPKQVFENKGIKVVTASTEREAISKFGARQRTDWKTNEVKPEDYDAVAFIGGPGAGGSGQARERHEKSRAENRYRAPQKPCEPS